MTSDEILELIDSVVGPPDSESPEDREKRRLKIDADHRRREIRRIAND